MAGEEIERHVGAVEVVRDAFESIPVLVAALEGPEHRFQPHSPAGRRRWCAGHSFVQIDVTDRVPGCAPCPR